MREPPPPGRAGARRRPADPPRRPRVRRPRNERTAVATVDDWRGCRRSHAGLCRLLRSHESVELAPASSIPGERRLDHRQGVFPRTRAPQCCVASAPVEAGVRTGGCLCGAVRYSVRGDPVHVVRCHCADCRKESGSAFSVYAHWPVEAFEMSGEISSYDGRGFCPRCGSRVLDTTDRSDALIEIRIGSLDAPGTLLELAHSLDS